MDTGHIEICCNSVQSAANAHAAGATRIELCQDLAAGGTTPSYATIKYCIETLHLNVYTLIRPRAGDFCYNNLEFRTIIEDIKICRDLGATGVVVGFLHHNGTVNKALTHQAVEAARPMQVTFHRAFDVCCHWPTALEDVISCGCDRILTSGCQPTVTESIATLSRIVASAAGRIGIMAGSGITSDNVRTVVHQTGVREIHASCKHRLDDGCMETSTEFVKQLIHICHEL